MTKQAGAAVPPKPANRAFHVTVAGRDGKRKGMTMLAPVSTSHAEAVESLKARFGADRVLSVV